MRVLECDLRYLRVLYRNDYVICKLYEMRKELFRVFEFQDFTIQREVVRQLMNSDASYFVSESTLCYIRPFEEGTSLDQWMQELHPLEECIVVCENILFELMQQSMSEELLATTVQPKSIAIDQHGAILLFQCPHFLLLRHPNQINFIQECAELCYKLLSSSSQLQRRRYRRKKQWKQFLQRLDHHFYRDYESLIDDLVALKKLDKKEHYNFDKLISYAAYTLLIFVLIAFSMIGFIKLSEYLHHTYERLPYIGTQPTKL